MAKLPGDVMDSSPVRRKAGKFGDRIAHRAVGIIDEERCREWIGDVGSILHVLIPGFLGHVPLRLTELVIPRRVVRGQIVVIVFAVIDGVCADVDVVSALSPGITDAGIACKLRVGSPRRRLTPCRQANLRGPVIVPLRGHVNAGLGVAIIRVGQRVRIGIVVWRKLLSFNVGKRNVAPYSGRPFPTLSFGK